MGDYEITIRKRGFMPDDTIHVAIRLTDEMVELGGYEILDHAFRSLKEDLLKQLPVKFKTIYRREVFESTSNKEI